MLHSPELVDSMFQAAGGDVLRYGGREVYGHLEVPVDEVDAYDAGAGTLIAQPSFVCANGLLPDIGYDVQDGARGIGVTVEIRERALDGAFGPPYEWRVSNVLRRGDDGGEVRLLLSEVG